MPAKWHNPGCENSNRILRLGYGNSSIKVRFLKNYTIYEYITQRNVKKGGGIRFDE